MAFMGFVGVFAGRSGGAVTVKGTIYAAAFGGGSAAKVAI